MTLAGKSFPGSTFALVFEDAFPYAAGNLNGQGGWTLWGGLPTWKTIAPGINQQSTGVKGNKHDLLTDPGGPLSITATFTPDMPSNQLAVLQVGIGLTALANGIYAYCDFEDGDAVLNRMSFLQLLDSTGVIASVGPIACNQAVSHTVKLSLQGGQARVYLDGVLQIPFTSYATAGIDPNLALSSLVSDAGDALLVTDVLVSTPA